MAIKEVNESISRYKNSSQQIYLEIGEETYGEEPYFVIKEKQNGEFHDSVWNIFYVSKKNCTPYYYDTVTGNLVTIDRWRLNRKGTAKKTNSKSSTSKVNKTPPINPGSMVISCGSGCAMTYSAIKIIRKLPVVKVFFKVDVYLDEKLSDTYTETYWFEYDQSKKLKTVHLEGNKENVLKTLLPAAQNSFKEFADKL